MDVNVFFWRLGDSGRTQAAALMRRVGIRKRMEVVRTNRSLTLVLSLLDEFRTRTISADSFSLLVVDIRLILEELLSHESWDLVSPLISGCMHFGDPDRPTTLDELVTMVDELYPQIHDLATRAKDQPVFLIRDLRNPQSHIEPKRTNRALRLVDSLFYRYEARELSPTAFCNLLVQRQPILQALLPPETQAIIAPLYQICQNWNNYDADTQTDLETLASGIDICRQKIEALNSYDNHPILRLKK